MGGWRSSSTQLLDHSRGPAARHRNPPSGRLGGPGPQCRARPRQNLGDLYLPPRDLPDWQDTEPRRIEESSRRCTTGFDPESSGLLEVSTYPALAAAFIRLRYAKRLQPTGTLHGVDATVHEVHIHVELLYCEPTLKVIGVGQQSISCSAPLGFMPSPKPPILWKLPFDEYQLGSRLNATAGLSARHCKTTRQTRMNTAELEPPLLVIAEKGHEQDEGLRAASILNANAPTHSTIDK